MYKQNKYFLYVYLTQLNCEIAIMKKAIVVLTRGYSNYESYSSLLLRNKQIEMYLQDKTTDILIFHEGNIHHQKEIQKETPTLRIHFIDITEFAFKKEYESVQVDPETSGFGIGYRHMCSFWFVDFWNFVKDYDFILRIDEDCFIEFVPDKVFEILENVSIVSGRYEKDEGFVTKGLNEHTRRFLFKKTGSIPPVKLPSGPYTNLCGFSLVRLRNPLLQEYIKSVKESKQIYAQRWGDLPLWGEAIYYLGISLFTDTSLKYFHQSHHLYVNP